MNGEGIICYVDAKYNKSRKFVEDTKILLLDSVDLPTD